MQITPCAFLQRDFIIYTTLLSYRQEKVSYIPGWTQTHNVPRDELELLVSYLYVPGAGTSKITGVCHHNRCHMVLRAKPGFCAFYQQTFIPNSISLSYKLLLLSSNNNYNNKNHKILFFLNNYFALERRFNE